MNEEIRGLALLVEDSKKVGDKYRYQHFFRTEANGVWSVLNNSAVPPYRTGFLATSMESLTADQIRRIILK